MLDLDSLDAVDIAVTIEETIGFQFDTDSIGEIHTLQDVVDVICGAAGSPKP